MSKKAYTLIELLVVMAIIAMTAVLALPAFQKYSKITEFKQKAEEVRELFNSAGTLALAPQSIGSISSTDIDSYKIEYNKAASPNEYTLSACKTVACSGSDKVPINKVKLLKTEMISGAVTAGTVFECGTKLTDGQPAKCTTTVDGFAFSDSSSDVSKIAQFTLLDPFKVTLSYKDL